MCYATVDTDAIGSCWLPAACCGVTGFKATYGLVSNKGVLEGEPVDETILKIPCGFDKNCLPLGLQIVGPKWGEDKVLDTAYECKQSTNWHLKHPID